MMLIVDDPQCEIEIRQAAVVNLKTFLENSWKPKEGAFVLPENEKEIIRGTLVDALIR
jgi:hypothetical protein